MRTYEAALQRRNANCTPLTPADFLVRESKGYGDKIALLYGQVKLAWRQTSERCIRLAGALAATHAVLHMVKHGEARVLFIDTEYAAVALQEWDSEKHRVYSWALLRIDSKIIFEWIRERRVMHFSGAPMVHSTLADAPDDLGVLIADGCVKLKDCNKDITIPGGENIPASRSRTRSISIRLYRRSLLWRCRI